MLVLPDHLLCQILVECGTRAHLLQLILRHQPLLSETTPSASTVKHIPLPFRRILTSGGGGGRVSDGGLRFLYREVGG